jgi:hypothetical protein
MGRNTRHMKSIALPTSTMAVNRLNICKSSEYEKWIVETGVGVVLYTASSRPYLRNKTLHTKYAIRTCGTDTEYGGVFWWAILTIAWVWEARSASAVLLTTGCSSLVWSDMLCSSYIAAEQEAVCTGNSEGLKQRLNHLSCGACPAPCTWKRAVSEVM